MYLLCKYGNHSTSKSELHNNGLSNVEKLFCSHYFLQNDRMLTQRWKVFREFYGNFRFTFFSFFMISWNLNKSNFVQILWFHSWKEIYILKDVFQITSIKQLFGVPNRWPNWVPHLVLCIFKGLQGLWSPDLSKSNPQRFVFSWYSKTINQPIITTKWVV